MCYEYAILLVDDDEGCLEFGDYILRTAGYSVDCARDGREALELFSPDRHGLIITDLRMPRMSGNELLRNVLEIAPDIPVIVITANPVGDIVDVAPCSGTIGYLHKPYSSDGLLALVKAVRDLPCSDGK